MKIRRMKKNFKRKVKKFNRKSRIPKGISLLGKHAKSKFTQSFQIFAIQVAAGISMYGFDGTSFATNSLSQDALEPIYNDSAFVNMCGNYGLYRIHGMSVNIARQLPVNQTAISTATPFSLGVVPENQQVVNTVLTNAQGIAGNNYDVCNHIKYVNENETGWWSKYYSFDKQTIGILTGGTDLFTLIPIGKTWVNTSAASYTAQNRSLFIVIGYDIAPIFSSTITDQAVVVAQMDLTYYVEFACFRGATAVAP